MTNSNIITNQFVRINQTPASIGERVLARILDTIFISFGFTGVYLLFDGLMGSMDETRWLMFLFFMLVIFIWMYDFCSHAHKSFSCRALALPMSIPARGCNRATATYRKYARDTTLSSAAT